VNTGAKSKPGGCRTCAAHCELSGMLMISFLRDVFLQDVVLEGAKSLPQGNFPVFGQSQRVMDMPSGRPRLGESISHSVRDQITF